MIPTIAFILAACLFMRYVLEPAWLKRYDAWAEAWTERKLRRLFRIDHGPRS